MDASYCGTLSNQENVPPVSETLKYKSTVDTDDCSNSSSSTATVITTLQGSSTSTSDTTIADDYDDDDIDNTKEIDNIKKNLCMEEEFRSINHSEQIHIFLKLKPLSESEQSRQTNNKNCLIAKSDTEVVVNAPNKTVYANLQNKKTVYQFSYVFQPDISQLDFFTATIQPCFKNFFNGDNLLIFSYGITNSGKTYTMHGTHQNPGIIFRTIDVVFCELKENLKCPSTVYKFKPDKFNEIILLNENEQKAERQLKEQLLRSPVPQNNQSDGKIHNSSTQYAIWISYYELYNDSVYDLLAQPKSQTNRNIVQERPSLKIREDMNRIPYVEGLVQIPIFNTAEAIKILKYGEKNLQKASNNINTNSSRSHAVFSLKIVRFDNVDSQNKGMKASINQLCFCDLAGIERSSKTNSVGKSQKEASNINSSILSLSRCINTMIQNQKNK
jgi:kinesin family member 20